MWIGASIEKKMQYWDALLKNSNISKLQFDDISFDSRANLMYSEDHNDESFNYGDEFDESRDFNNQFDHPSLNEDKMQNNIKYSNSNSL